MKSDDVLDVWSLMQVRFDQFRHTPFFSLFRRLSALGWLVSETIHLCHKHNYKFLNFCLDYHWSSMSVQLSSICLYDLGSVTFGVLKSNTT